mgnify:CR=1 FL=1
MNKLCHADIDKGILALWNLENELNMNGFEIDPSIVDMNELKKYRFIDIRHPRTLRASRSVDWKQKVFLTLIFP